MHTKIEVTDLNQQQWDWLQANLLTDYRLEFVTRQHPRVCAVFVSGVSPELERHVEMPLLSFDRVLGELHLIGEGFVSRNHVLDAAFRSIAAAAGAITAGGWCAPPDQALAEQLREDADSDRLDQGEDASTCDHGEAMVAEQPSAFEKAQPVRTYADGCQSYGPNA